MAFSREGTQMRVSLNLFYFLLLVDPIKYKGVVSLTALLSLKTIENGMTVYVSELPQFYFISIDQFCIFFTTSFLDFLLFSVRGSTFKIKMITFTYSNLISSETFNDFSYYRKTRKGLFWCIKNID